MNLAGQDLKGFEGRLASGRGSHLAVRLEGDPCDQADVDQCNGDCDKGYESVPPVGCRSRCQTGNPG